MLVMLLGQPRVFFSMALDGLFPTFATKVHPRFGTPYVDHHHHRRGSARSPAASCRSTCSAT